MSAERSGLAKALPLIHAVDIAVLGALLVLVFLFDKPGSLLLLAIPTTLAALLAQYLVLREEAAAAEQTAGE